MLEACCEIPESSYWPKGLIHGSPYIWKTSIDRIRSAFSRNRTEMAGLIILARRVLELTRDVDGYIEDLTRSICPDCQDVCCINRHSWPEFDDLIYLAAIDEEPPPYEPRLNDLEPCRYLGPTGCLKPRHLRPFRCNWYFCVTITGEMNSRGGREMRRYTDRMTELVRTRGRLIEEFRSLAKRGGWE